MEIIYVIISLTLLSLKTVRSQGCDACINSVCYANTDLGEFDPTFVQVNKEFAVYRVKNIIYYTPLRSNIIQALDLTNKTVRTVIEANASVLGIALHQTTGNLYFSTYDSEVFKYNPVSNETLSIMKPIDDSYGTTPGRRWFEELLFSGKLYALPEYYLSPRLYEYDPETSNVKQVDALKLVDVREPLVDRMGDIYYEDHHCEIFKLSKDSDTPVTFKNCTLGKFYTYSTDKDGFVYFIELYTKIYRLDYSTNELMEVGAIPNVNYLLSFNFDKHNNMIYLDGNTMHYLTANTYHCKVHEITKPNGVKGTKIEKI